MSVTMDAPQILTGAAAEAVASENLNAGGFRKPAVRDFTKLVETANLWHDFLHGSIRESKRAGLYIQENITTSDLPYLLGAVLDRELLNKYEEYPTVWQGFATKSLVRDFKPKKLNDLLGGRAILDVVGEGAPYKRVPLSDAEYSLSVAKRGNIIPVTFEDLVNDDLDALRNLPDRQASAARFTEDYVATSAIVDAAGSKTAFFVTVGTDKLTAANIAKAVSTVTARKDSEGLPVILPKLVLMVPPALQITALEILNAVEIEVSADSTAAAPRGAKTVRASNYLKAMVTLVVNPWLTVIDKSANAGSTWYLLPDPSGPRPAVAVGFLRGHETPDLRVKADTGQRIGGGAISPEDGSFDDDSIEYRVRHVTGSTTVDPLGAYASNGSN
ncbi:Mu-like prophage major head subunit gpT family protein [Xylanimonas protaetiae]|uniref:Uncharacterized protein n=1 Tax=Xylanimonas protaetiae TaxID=2509457 RepID=A0A4P6F5F3_9MICO|nr:Mu-like prophage major head subunit gpT family protein [Xylanimonas protaetiae]QAY69993.1 hypothetical protein ET471_08080 [Xylanimonas protaetiae]